MIPPPRPTCGKPKFVTLLGPTVGARFLHNSLLGFRRLFLTGMGTHFNLRDIRYRIGSTAPHRQGEYSNRHSHLGLTGHHRSSEILSRASPHLIAAPTIVIGYEAAPMVSIYPTKQRLALGTYRTTLPPPIMVCGFPKSSVGGLQFSCPS